MKALVVYATRSGNTRRVAEAIADGIRSAGSVEVSPVDAAPALTRRRVDLLVVGGPTEGRHMTPAMREFLERLPCEVAGGALAAAFDTRVAWPKLLSGSAAEDIRGQLERMSARGPIRMESFIVSMAPEIRPEELERARAWGAYLAVEATQEPTAAAAAAR